MKVKELIEILKEYPEDMEIWVSDRGYCEGGEKLVTVEKVIAYDVGLDGDEVDDEYIYIEEDTDVPYYLSKGYQLLKSYNNILSKEILYLNNN